MTDRAVRQAVLDGLAADPSLDTVHIGVAVDAGIVTLTGHVASYAGREAAAAAARRVPGVRGVVEQVKVRLPNTRRPRDEDLARQAARILDGAIGLPPDAIRVKARDGWITLTGTVTGPSEKSEVQAAVARTPGLLGLINLIEVG